MVTRILSPTFILLTVVWLSTAPLFAQSTSPIATPTATVQATATPTAQGNLIARVIQQNQDKLVLALITALITGILVGVFIKRFANAIGDGISRLFDWLFSRISYTLVARWRYEKYYRRNLAGFVQNLASAQIVERPIDLATVYVPVVLTEELRSEKGSSYEAIFQWQEDLRRKQRSRAVAQWDAVVRYPRLVVLGDPGAGKIPISTTWPIAVPKVRSYLAISPLCYGYVA